jgi:2-keto-3-deoxy-L-rhamnonate aldolase RhmA
MQRSSPPWASRGVSRGRKSYGNPNFLTHDNDETFLVVQHEDSDALGNCEEIAAASNLDGRLPSFMTACLAAFLL